ncbi:MAG: hypothetical protein O8C64_06750 [Candidatus Methanoperedens sp.]|nr:hypothetical protein [Candidatus Methanoperedens sp.]
MKCPTCNGDCIQPAEKVLDEIFGMYMACSSCPSDPRFDKNAPFKVILDSGSGHCSKCGRRHLDFVVGNVLALLKRTGLFPEDAALREVGTPLIAFGYRIPYPPRLGRKSLVLIMDSITEEAAIEIVEKVPEIKGVIKRKGLQSRSVGILDTDSNPHTYELLAGCDMRCDVISSSFGELCIYKNQSRIHIEFNNTKIGKMEELYIKGELDRTFIIDGFCGPGTLGLLSVLGGAKKVILNDAWLPAIKNAILNIKVNSKILGVKIDFELQDYEKLIGDEPILLATAEGNAKIMVYHGDVRRLNNVVKECDTCLIDTFPSIDPSEFIHVCRDFARKVVVI